MMRLFASLLIVVVLLAGCGGDGDKEGNQPDPTATHTAADLAVTNIELTPAQFGLGQSFTVKVYVANLGGAASDKYELTINLRDVTRGTTSPIGTLPAGQSIAPGQEILAYETGQRQINETGSFQIQVELTPAGTDGDTNNNRKNRAFSIQ